MSLINCPDCGTEVSNTAFNCPKCNSNIRLYMNAIAQAEENKKKKKVALHYL